MSKLFNSSNWNDKWYFAFPVWSRPFLFLLNLWATFLGFVRSSEYSSLKIQNLEIVNLTMLNFLKILNKF